MRRPLVLALLAIPGLMALPSVAETRVGVEHRAAVSFTVPARDGGTVTLMVEAFQGVAPGASPRATVRVVPGSRRSYAYGSSYEGALPAGALTFDDAGARLVTRLGGLPLRVEWTARDVGFQTAVTTGFAIYHGAELNAPAFVEYGSSSCSIGDAVLSTTVVTDADTGTGVRPLPALPRLRAGRCTAAGD